MIRIIGFELDENLSADRPECADLFLVEQQQSHTHHRNVKETQYYPTSNLHVSN